MKNKLLLILLMATLAFNLTSCNRKEMEKLRRERDSLANLTNEKQSKIDEYLSYFNEIQQNLNTIKQKEHIITLQTSDTTEMTPAMKDQINNDILTIYQLMQENKDALTKLKKQIKSSGIKNKQLEETIALYEQQMKQKDDEIASLKEKLEKMNFNMAELNKKIDEMQQKMVNMEEEQNKQKEIINQQENQLNTIYYIVGTKTELKDKQILTRDGFLSKLSVDANFDKSQFVTGDKRNIDEITINAKSIQILTKHPSNSYTLKKNNKNVIEKIVITDKEQFWSISKFLVVLVN